MKKKYHWWLSALCFTSLAVNAAPGEGIYFGGQLGQSNTHNKDQTIATGGSPAFVTVSPTNTGLGGRLYLGYSGNRYFGAELGYTYFAPSTYDTKVEPICDKPSIRENAIDLVGKGTIPIRERFAVFGKAGVALANQSMSGSLSDPTTTTCDSEDSGSSIRPVLGIGASYDITQRWVFDVSWTRVLGGSSFQSADLIALGIAYHLIDEKCGQFLC